ncbi:GAF domain-containing protein [Sporolactobacillus vineae]|jgi:GAF domain-containing protein|uniref:GAF domain-containing protein n=1 Tax=Sporolactobacillus vineae TaxID=444463 RepID=UPI000289E3A7|nr:GAF domain-containing protein [Sporolactobacillus vineae]
MNSVNKTRLQVLESLVKDEPSRIANLANSSSWLNECLDRVNWVGFYLLDKKELVLGPFQGKPACVRIPLGKGVCGTAAQNNEIVRVADVHDFPGYISCDEESRSEIVVPLISGNRLIGVLDIDSPVTDRFSEDDQQFLEAFAETLVRYL